MYPRKKWFGAAAQPFDCGVDDLASPALCLQLHTRVELRERRVEGIESFPETVFRPQDEGANEASGPVAPGLEEFCERAGVLRQRCGCVVADRQTCRVLAGQKRRVSGPGQRRLRRRIVE